MRLPYPATTRVLFLTAGMLIGAWIKGNIDAQNMINHGALEFQEKALLMQVIAAYQHAVETRLDVPTREAIGKDISSMSMAPAEQSNRPLWLAAIIGPDSTFARRAIQQATVPAVVTQ
jgi:hypothetical protein